MSHSHCVIFASQAPFPSLTQKIQTAGVRRGKVLLRNLRNCYSGGGGGGTVQSDSRTNVTTTKGSHLYFFLHVNLILKRHPEPKANSKPMQQNVFLVAGLSSFSCL